MPSFFRHGMRTDLEAFYKHYNPEKVADLDSIMTTAATKRYTEQQLFHTMYEKYNLVALNRLGRDRVAEAAVQCVKAVNKAVWKEIQAAAAAEEEAVNAEVGNAPRQILLSTGNPLNDDELESLVRFIERQTWWTGPANEKPQLRDSGFSSPEPYQQALAAFGLTEKLTKKLHAEYDAEKARAASAAAPPPAQQVGQEGGAPPAASSGVPLRGKSFRRDACQSESNKGDRVSDERRRVDAIMAEEIREWLLTMLEEDDNEKRAGGAAPTEQDRELVDQLQKADNVVDALRDGVILQRVLRRLVIGMSQAAGIKPPAVPRTRPRAGSFQARDLVAQFIMKSKSAFSLRDEVMFTDTDLVDGKNDRAVITCLLSMAKMTATTGAGPAPKVVQYEKEIDEQQNSITDELLEAVMQEEDDGDEEEEEDDAVAAEELLRLLEQQRVSLEVDEDSRRQGVLSEYDAVCRRIAEIFRKEMQYAKEEEELAKKLAEEWVVLRRQQEEVERAAVETRRQAEEEAAERARLAEERRQAQLDAVAAAVAARKEASPPGSPKSPKAKYVVKKSDEVDVMVGAVVNRVIVAEPSQVQRQTQIRVRRLRKQGEYLIFNRATNKKQVAYVRVLQKQLMIRVGGGWEEFEHYLRRRVKDWDGEMKMSDMQPRANRLGGAAVHQQDDGPQGARELRQRGPSFRKK